MCSLSHLHRSLSDVLSPTARIHPALAEPLGGQAAWLGWPLWPAVIAVSAHPETSGQFLSLTPSCLRFAGKANLMAPPSPLWPAPGWSQPVPWTLGLPSLCLQPRRSLITYGIWEKEGTVQHAHPLTSPSARSRPVEWGCPLFKGGTRSKFKVSKGLAQGKILESSSGSEASGLGHQQPLRPSIPARWKPNSHTKNCMWMFLAVSLTVGLEWKQHRRFSTSEWGNWSVHTVKYHSTLDRNKLLIPSTSWINLPESYMHEKSKSPQVT